MRHNNPSYTEKQRRFMCAEYGRKKAGKRTRTGMREEDVRDFCQKPVVPKSERKGKWMKKVRAYRKTHKKNPHLISGKWQYVGLFKKKDVHAVKRILQIHGIAYNVTANHTEKLRGKGYRELYVARETFDTAYCAITRLYEGRMAA